jgi:hypothetical protein
MQPRCEEVVDAEVEVDPLVGRKCRRQGSERMSCKCVLCCTVIVCEALKSVAQQFINRIQTRWEGPGLRLGYLVHGNELA